MIANQFGDDVLAAAFETELGWMALAAREYVLIRLTFGHRSPQRAIGDLHLAATEVIEIEELWPELAERLAAYATGAADPLRDVKLELSHLSPFERRVVEHCRRIPYGQTATYGGLAALAGSPRAARAVGNVMASNRFPLIVPCHRVVAAGGKIGNYSSPARPGMKLRLLEMEGSWQDGKPSQAARLGSTQI